jgi:spore coat protein CotF
MQNQLLKKLYCIKKNCKKKKKKKQLNTNIKFKQVQQPRVYQFIVIFFLSLIVDVRRF